MIDTMIWCAGAPAALITGLAAYARWVRLPRLLRDAYSEGFSALAEAVESKDPLSKGHGVISAVVASRIAREMRLSHRDQIEYSALLQDVGNAAVPQSLLTKPGRLTPTEFELVKVHPRVGAQLLAEADRNIGERFYNSLAPIVLSHHERVDGKGYPDGLKRAEIPIGSRVLAVASCYAALTAPRAHRPPFSPSFALRVVRSDRGTKFDPDVVDAFSSVMARTSPADLLEARL